MAGGELINIHVTRFTNFFRKQRIINIDSVDPVSETVNVGFDLEISWFDKRLSYDTSNCSMPLLIDRISSIWYPAFMIANAASDVDYASLKERSAIVEPSGLVRWPVYMYMSLACNMDIRNVNT